MLKRLCFQPLNSFVILIAQSLKIMNATSKEIWRKLCRMWRDFINCCRMWHQWGCRILVFRMFSDRSQILQSDVLFPYGCLQKGGSKSEDYQKTQSAGEIMSISIVFKSQLSAASWSDWLPVITILSRDSPWNCFCFVFLPFEGRRDVGHSKLRYWLISMP